MRVAGPFDEVVALVRHDRRELNRLTVGVRGQVGLPGHRVDAAGGRDVERGHGERVGVDRERRSHGPVPRHPQRERAARGAGIAAPVHEMPAGAGHRGQVHAGARNIEGLIGRLRHRPAPRDRDVDGIAGREVQCPDIVRVIEARPEHGQPVANGVVDHGVPVSRRRRVTKGHELAPGRRARQRELPRAVHGSQRSIVAGKQHHAIARGVIDRRRQVAAAGEAAGWRELVPRGLREFELPDIVGVPRSGAPVRDQHPVPHGIIDRGVEIPGVRRNTRR